MLSLCVHKEQSQGSRKYHDNIVTDINEKNLEYCDSFLMSPTVVHRDRE